MYTLSAIAVRHPTSPLGGRSATLPLQSMLWTARVSDRSTVSSALVRFYSSNDADAEAQSQSQSQSSFLAVACEFVLVAAQQEPALVLSLPLLDGYGLTLPLDGRTGPALEGGVLLANGSCYMLQRDGR